MRADLLLFSGFVKSIVFLWTLTYGVIDFVISSLMFSIFSRLVMRKAYLFAVLVSFTSFEPQIASKLY